MSWSRTLCVAVLLGVAALPGCAYDPDAAPPAQAQAHSTPPAPGTLSVHMNGSVNSEYGVGR
jgi:hypothetical protein